MNFRSTAVRNTLVACILSASAAAIAFDKPNAEILHWWKSPGEAAALNVFIEAFKARGGHYYDSTKRDQTASRDEAIDRLSKGYPSTLTQWNAGRDVIEFFEYGLISSIKEPKLVEKLQSSLPKAVLDAVTHKGEIIAMPVNIHSENWMWYSDELLKYSDSIISNDWRGFIEQGKELSKKNIPLLAVGDQPWQVRILFTSLFLGISRDDYKEFYLNINPSVANSKGLDTVLNVFAELAKYSKSFGDGNWNTQVKAVADNLAGTTFMGDWAKGEFQSLGKKAGEDFGCALTAGTDPSLLLVIDSFILGKVQDNLEKAGQSLMLDVISDPEVNRQFNELKGSVSPFSKPASDELDPCSTQVYETLSKNDSVIPPYASYNHGRSLHLIDNGIYKLWKDAQAGEVDSDYITELRASFHEHLKTAAEDSSLNFAATEE